MYFPDKDFVLSQRESKALLPYLLKQLGAQKPDVRNSALGKLIDIGRRHKSLREICRQACRAAATDPSVDMRDSAADGLGYLGDRRDYRCLSMLLMDEEEFVRNTAVESMFVVGPQLAFPKMREALLSDPSDLVRAYAAGGLLLLERPDLTVPALRESLEHLQDYPKGEVLDVLVELEGESHLPAWLQLMTSEDFLPGDLLVDKLLEEVERFGRFSLESKLLICEALEKRIAHLPTYEFDRDWRTDRVKSVLDVYRKMVANQSNPPNE